MCGATSHACRFDPDPHCLCHLSLSAYSHSCHAQSSAHRAGPAGRWAGLLAGPRRRAPVRLCGVAERGRCVACSGSRSSESSTRTRCSRYRASTASRGIAGASCALCASSAVAPRFSATSAVPRFTLCVAASRASRWTCSRTRSGRTCRLSRSCSATSTALPMRAPQACTTCALLHSSPSTWSFMCRRSLQGTASCQLGDCTASVLTPDVKMPWAYPGASCTALALAVRHSAPALCASKHSCRSQICRPNAVPALLSQARGGADFPMPVCSASIAFVPVLSHL